MGYHYMSVKLVAALLLGVISLFHVNAAHGGLDIVVKETDGDVEIMMPDNHRWVAANAGSLIPEGTKIRTGPFSSAVLDFIDSSVAVVDSFTFLTIEKYFESENIVTTRIQLPIGSIVATLNDNAENDYEIVTPTSTVSLNGTEIKKVIAGAMYSDSVMADHREK